MLCHALESYTAVPFSDRVGGVPKSPMHRPAYQGCNPISDVWSSYALTQCAKYFARAVTNPDDDEAREQMCLAATAAGVGFGMHHFMCALCSHECSFLLSALCRYE